MNTIIGAVLFSVFVTSCIALFIVAINYSRLTKYAIIAISGTIMIAHGSRIISQTILYPGSVYQPGFFDLVFDWLTLVWLGFFVAWFGFKEFYKQEKKYSEKRRKK